MTDIENPQITEYPKIVSRAEWLTARTELLAKERALTRQRDAVNAVALGIKAPLNYSVFAASAGAFFLAATTNWQTEEHGAPSK